MSETTKESRSYSVRELSDRYKIGAWIIRQWIANGQLAATNMAPTSDGRRHWRIDEKDFEEFMARRRSPALLELSHSA